MQYTVGQAGALGNISRRGLGFPFAGALRKFIGNRNNLIGALILAPIIVVAFTAQWLPISDPLQPSIIDSLQGPSLQHPFGTDKLGRDIFSRTISGLRVSLMVGFAAAGLALVSGLVLGTLAGFLGKQVDTAISAVVDLLLAFPSLLLAIGFVSIFGPGMWQIIGAIAISDAPRAIRLQRSLALSLKSRTYIVAARMASAPTWWLLIRHVVPNTIAPMIVVASIYASNAILAEAALSFIGLGFVPPEPSLGNLISDGQNYLREAWWISTFPGIAIVVVSIALHLFSDGIRENLDPRSTGH
jgi:peptide/nickel transport system permease protein